MGTVVSFALAAPDSADGRAAIEAAVQWLHLVDRTLSPYREDSEVSRMARGELSPGESGPLLAEVLSLGDNAVSDGQGAFTLHPGGRFDPSGLVKGWALERASAILVEFGMRDHLVNGGGDVQAEGDREPGVPWRVAIADPRDRTRTIAVLGARDGGLAVATSGTAERGEHIHGASGGTLSLTVVGRSLTEVDVAATTAFALGDKGRAWIDERPSLAGMAVMDGGRMWTSQRFADYIVA